MSNEMTKEEAIKHIKAMCQMLLGADNKPISDTYYALEMALEKLSAEPCEDAISRQAALDAIFNNAEKPDDAYSAVRMLASFTPKQSGWHYTDLPPSDDPYKRYLVVYSPYDRNYGRNTAPRFEIADYYKGDGLYNDRPWHLTISHSVMEKEILAWKDIGIVDEVMQGAKMEEQA